MVNFAADDSILGFKYQIRYALFLLFEAQRIFGLDVAIAIEQIDDLDLHADGKLTKLVQTKNTATVLTNASAPFWKTVRIWSEAITEGRVNVDEVDAFELVATSGSPTEDDAIVNLLGSTSPEAKDKALTCMRSLAEAKREQATLGPAYSAFHKLGAQEQESLVRKITVRVDAPSFDDLDRSIVGQIVHGPPGKREPFARVLFGQWEMLVERYLREGKRKTIEWSTLQSLLHEIALQFQDDNLPVVFDGMLREVFRALTDDKRTFMRQLEAIAASDEQRRRAQRFYLKATQLLGFWQRHVLLRPDEVIAHSERLIDECAIQHEAANADPARATTDNSIIGQRIYSWAVNEAAHHEALRIRPRCTDPDVIRGCFHSLADRPRLGWHPAWSTLFGSPASSGT